jgi:hypothetical protein
LGFDFGQKSSQEDNTPLSFYTQNLIIPTEISEEVQKSLIRERKVDYQGPQERQVDNLSKGRLIIFINQTGRR